LANYILFRESVKEPSFILVVASEWRWHFWKPSKPT